MPKTSMKPPSATMSSETVAARLDDLPPLIGLDQYAQVLGVSRSSVYRAVNTDTLGVPLLHVLGRMYVRTADVRRFLFGD